MGLWVQNLGVESPNVAEELTAMAASDSAALPRMPGWTWLTLRDALDEAGLDGAVARAAAVAGVRALGFSVEDSDTAYVVAATPAGISFRLRLNATAGENQDAQAAAAFTGAAIEPIGRALGQSYVYAEQGVQALLAAMGLVSAGPPPAIARDEEQEPDDQPEEAANLVAAIRSNPRGRRWAASAEAPFPGRWVVIAAEQDASGRVAASFCSRRDRIEIVPLYRDIAELRQELTSEESGVELGAWHEVPDGVSRSLAATTAWAFGEIR
jgi:hypothetical protein